MEKVRFILIYKKKNYNLVLMFESSDREDGDLFDDDVDIKEEHHARPKSKRKKPNQLRYRHHFQVVRGFIIS